MQLHEKRRMLLPASLLVFLAVAPTSVVLQSVTTSPADSVTVLRAPDGRVRGIQDNRNADFVLGGLFPLRQVVEGTIQCGSIRPERGIERMEAMLYAIDVINNSTELLPGLKLGFDLRDTCSSETVGLEESLDILVSGGVLSDAIGTDGDCLMNSNASSVTTPLGLVGAASSSVSLPVATLMRLFMMPQISYASSSSELSDAERFMYFLRTIPPDNLQTAAMVDLLDYFNWTFVSTVHSRDSYGENGIRDFRQNAQNRSICTEYEGEFFLNSPTADYVQIASTLYHNTTSNVVILYCLDIFAYRVIEQVHQISIQNNFKRRFMFIASDAWAHSTNISRDFPETVAGYIGFLPFSTKHQGFSDYFSSLLPSNNIRNQESFTEFYGVVHNCSDSCHNATAPVTNTSDYSQGSFIPLVIDAVFAYAHALQKFLDMHCSQPIQWDRNTRRCIGSNTTLDTSVLLDYLFNITFNSSSGPLVDFDTSGNVNAPYQITNFQVQLNNDGGSVLSEFVTVGEWVPRNAKGMRLILNVSKIQFGLEAGEEIILRTSPVESNCGRPCDMGHYRQVQPDGCCWRCAPCVANNFSSDPAGIKCSSCPAGQWGSEPLTGSSSCVNIPIIKLTPADPIAIVVVVLSSLSLIAVAIVIFVFIINFKHPVVKSSGREQVALLLTGITLSFCLSYIIIIPSSTAVCFFERLVIWTSFSLIYGALLVKIVRVARIFLRTPSSPRPRFTEPHYQVIFTLCIVGVQLVITAVSMIVVYPVSVQETRSNEGSRASPMYVITCQAINPILFTVHILYDAALILLCTFFGWRTRNFPENFNEAKYVLFTSLALILIWLGFIPTYIATQGSSEYSYAALNFPILLSSLAVLIIFFVPKIYFIYARRNKEPEQGNKGSNDNYLSGHINLSRFSPTVNTATTSGIHSKEPSQSPTVVHGGGVAKSFTESTINRASPLLVDSRFVDSNGKEEENKTV